MGAILQMPFSVEAHITPLSSSSREDISLLGSPSVTVSLYNLVLSQTLMPSSVANHSSPLVYPEIFNVLFKIGIVSSGNIQAVLFGIVIVDTFIS